MMLSHLAGCLLVPYAALVACRRGEVQAAAQIRLQAEMQHGMREGAIQLEALQLLRLATLHRPREQELSLLLRVEAWSQPVYSVRRVHPLVAAAPRVEVGFQLACPGRRGLLPAAAVLAAEPRVQARTA